MSHTESGVTIAGRETHPPQRHGRFAPTPSGPLHRGSLTIAVASYLSARRDGGRWTLRLDDLDRARCPPEAAPRILGQLEAYGLYWDGQPQRQSVAMAQYERALAQLMTTGAVYACDCSRAERQARAGRLGLSGYDGHCRERGLAPGPGRALRLRIETASACGDPVLRRSDGIFGYALACALDEARLGITEVVRGADLEPETPAQLAVLERLGAPKPAYRHLPVLLGPDGRKLSKQNGAAAIPTGDRERRQTLADALERLGYTLPAGLAETPPEAQLRWARSQPARGWMP
jgi:glutamyl-Q tRNA(Asp) synthetase